MTTILQNGLSAAIGSQFLKQRNQLAFVEYASGNLSLLDMIRPLAVIVSKGSVILKGTWVFDCETGIQDGNLNGPGDIWWEQIDSIKRQMAPCRPWRCSIVSQEAAIQFFSSGNLSARAADRVGKHEGIK
jgi:hypothetical protein